MNLVFFSQENYPNGGAACNRHLAYLKSLAARGHDITLYAIGSQRPYFAPKDFKYVKIFDNNRNIIKHYIKCFFLLIVKCYKIKNKKNTKWIFLGTSGLLFLPLLILAKIGKMKIYHERTELPYLMTGSGFLSKFDYMIYKKILPWLDGIYVISKPLQNVLEKMSNFKVKVKIIKMTVDFSRFNKLTKKTKRKLKNILYAGDLSSPKDGVDLLIKAFSLATIRLKYSNLRLKIAGETKNNYSKTILRPLIKKLKLGKKISLIGLINRKSIPRLLITSDLLVLARPQSVQATYGFPSKLGEYLASRTPVLVTKTGEIAKYLTDKKDIYLVNSSDPQLLSEYLIWITRNYKNALKVGLNGYKTAKKHFCSTVIAKDLEKLFSS